MLDRIRQTLAPAAVQAEIDGIAVQLAKLDAEREELRLTAGNLVIQQTREFLPQHDRQISSLHEQIRKMDGPIRELRRRRRELTELAVQPSPAQKALVAVPKSADLVRAESVLAKAREDRADFMRGYDRDADATTARMQRAQLDVLDSRIADLRRKRGDLLAPYNAEVYAALQPIITAAAAQLLTASREFRAALATLAEANNLAPPAAPGLGNGLGPVVGIDQRPAHSAEAFALQLLGAPE